MRKTIEKYIMNYFIILSFKVIPIVFFTLSADKKYCINYLQDTHQ